MWAIKFTNNAEKDKKLLKGTALELKARKILDIMSENPFQNPPYYEKLVGDLEGYYSRRLNAQHRMVYRVIKETNTIVVHSMWTHYEK